MERKRCEMARVKWAVVTGMNSVYCSQQALCSLSRLHSVTAVAVIDESDAEQQ